MQKLMQISGFFRIAVIFGAVSILIYLGYGYFIQGDIRFSTSMLFTELWWDERASRQVLLAIQAPLFIMFLVGVYWLQKLLGFYHQGHFFGHNAMRCYLWLIWIKLADFALEIVQHLLTGYYHKSFFDKTHIELPLDFGNITTILLMLIIVYLLKAAREIEAENKEFI
ncbi:MULTISPECIES: DUF2975 domain-containing protein [unclassified Shewanella]|uniref:DUF2975 domain-containing protein n=1 Tax=unclassified Shewanella TaxID=196818 RepID=UPI001E488B61|nr:MULTISPECIES: DUF2975 domain-containing protein [unclassified Shewanella]